MPRTGQKCPGEDVSKFFVGFFLVLFFYGPGAFPQYVGRGVSVRGEEVYTECHSENGTSFIDDQIFGSMFEKTEVLPESS